MHRYYEDASPDQNVEPNRVAPDASIVAIVTTRLIDTLLLLALPASGKSEIRRYLDSLPPTRLASELHLGPTIQLDDYPYVHLMRRISQELRAREAPPLFFVSDDLPMDEPLDWGVLQILLNEDYATIGVGLRTKPTSPAGWLFDRIDAARVTVGAPAALATLAPEVRAEVAAALDDEVGALWDHLAALEAADPVGATVVIEFARGGPEGTEPPITPPFGYEYALGLLSPEILRRAAILYVQVTPEESRRRNDDRGRPGLEGDASILHHGVPEAVMRGDYGIDDLRWLLARGGGIRITVERDGLTFEVPTAVFDNRVDHTSFLRDEPALWPPEAVARLHDELAIALGAVAG